MIRPSLPDFHFSTSNGYFIWYETGGKGFRKAQHNKLQIKIGIASLFIYKVNSHGHWMERLVRAALST